MRKLLVNALSVTNASGRHVLQGHMRRVADELAGKVQLVVIGRADMTALREALPPSTIWEYAPPSTRGWLVRALWERRRMPELARKYDVFASFTPSGMMIPGLHIPQIVFCQNPWALVPAARRWHDGFKAWLQRRAYRHAMAHAAVMVFNSRYMQEAYRANAGRAEKWGLIVHQAADDAAHSRAREMASLARRSGRIICVSMMARHKNVEAVIRALAKVRAEHPAAHVALAGGWPDFGYERKIRDLVAQLNLEAAVEFTGFLPREKLEELYATAQVFCLMSRCESFGIPAIEAQLFGTPVVTSTVCAMPEIGGEGGLYRDPDDIPAIAEALTKLLTDADEWQRRSQLARANAARYQWQTCSQPLVDLIAEMTGES